MNYIEKKSIKNIAPIDPLAFPLLLLMIEGEICGFIGNCTGHACN